MTRVRVPFFVRTVVLASGVLASSALLGCHTTARTTLGPGPDGRAPIEPVEITTTERSITVAVAADGSSAATLGAQLVAPKGARGPGIVIVPGAGDISRHGVRPGDGVTTYAKPIAVYTKLAEGLAARGALVLTYDKRTCGPNDDPLCSKNPQDDVDAEGPAALAKDVDAACALLRAESGFDGRLVLFAHGQAAQVALASSCAKSASVVVLAAPIPRGVDEVIVAGLRERMQAAERAAKAEADPQKKQALVDEAGQLRNLAGTREAEFASMKAGRFAPTARVSGATLAFWKGWIESTSKTASLAEALPAAKLVVLGSEDRQYAAADKKRITALATAGVVEVAGADHHLLHAGALEAKTLDALGAALDAVLAKTPQS
jgi:alpha-beta hydrolase superfamily lysophospholipase